MRAASACHGCSARWPGRTGRCRCWPCRWASSWNPWRATDSCAAWCSCSSDHLTIHLNRESRVSDTADGAAMQSGTNRTSQALTAAGHAPALARTASGRRVLIIVENLPCPFDRRVMQEARTLVASGYAVSIICPKAPGYEQGFERIDGIDIHRHPLPREADGALGYALEYGVALCMEFWLSLKILFGRGFDI